MRAVSLPLSLLAAALCAIAIFSSTISAPVNAETPPVKNAAATKPASAVVQPRARDLLATMAAAYLNLKACSLKLVVKDVSGLRASEAITGSIVFQRPNMASVTIVAPSGTINAIADGKYIYMSSPQDKQEYDRQPSPPDSTAIRVAIQATEFDQIGILPFLVNGNDPYTVISHNLKSLTVLAPDVEDGVPVEVIQAVETAPGRGDLTMTLAIGRKDHLLRRIGVLATNLALIEAFSDVKVNPTIRSAEFQFVAPAGATMLTPQPPRQPANAQTQTTSPPATPNP